ncbi:MAG: hydroxymethylglutaryl-CoA lyase [Desulfobacteraceae bacterium]|nr:MAG: hydroxymethylglutaryl-CoA lyase [Desulfobacteraceae bacterium]
MIKIVEVGPRDGLQNEFSMVPTSAKIDFVNALSRTGVNEIEVSAFVSPKKIPQLQDAAIVFEKIHRVKGVVYSALVPNEKGLERAFQAGVDKVSLFTAASETFNQKNINTSIKGSLARFRPVVTQAGKRGRPIRAYISTAFWCAFEGKISAQKVVNLASSLMDMGIDELSISDTIGKATPDDVEQLMDSLLPIVPPDRIAVHYHDTYANGIANVLKSLSYGIRTVDASVGGLGGCPFAPGATGNVSTEDVIRALRNAGETLTANIDRLLQARELLNPYLPAPSLPETDPPDCSTCEFFNNGLCCGRHELTL